MSIRPAGGDLVTGAGTYTLPDGQSGCQIPGWCGLLGFGPDESHRQPTPWWLSYAIAQLLDECLIKVGAAFEDVAVRCCLQAGL